MRRSASVPILLVLIVLILLLAASCSSNPQSAATGTLPPATGSGDFAIPGRQETAIEVVVPADRPARPPLVIVFHGTGGEPMDVVNGFDLVAKASSLGFVAIAPRAGYRNGIHPPDVDHPLDSGDSSWNMWTANPDANEDLRYLRALVDAAGAQWNADTTRVYVAGFSNGAFFSYFAAASLPDHIAGFAENSGGWMTDACPTRTDTSGASLYLLTTGAPPGQDMTCATIFTDPMFPASCRATAANLLRPPSVGSRVPSGYLAHYSLDDTVSVAWSCLLAEALGDHARTRIRASELDGTTGHTMIASLLDDAWPFLSARTTASP
jgi:predicted esterase